MQLNGVQCIVQFLIYHCNELKLMTARSGYCTNDMARQATVSMQSKLVQAETITFKVIQMNKEDGISAFLTFLAAFGQQYQYSKSSYQQRQFSYMQLLYCIYNLALLLEKPFDKNCHYLQLKTHEFSCVLVADLFFVATQTFNDILKTEFILHC